MSRLEEISEQYRKREIVRNSYDKDDVYAGSHPNAVSDGDEKGKGLGSPGTVGGATDIKSREVAASKNKYNQERPYDDSSA